MPQCTPSRVTLLTGQYPFRHGWVNHWDVPRWGGGAHFDENMNPSIAREIKKAGYSTCIAGKWQIDDFRVEPDALTRNGFDEFCMWTGYESGIEASANRYHDPYLFTSNGSNVSSNEFGPDIFREFIETFIRQHQDSSFFVYYPMVLPHTPLVDTPDETADSDLGRHKAMVRYIDKNVGSIIKTLEDLQLRDNTLVILTSDNGSTGAVMGTRFGVEVKGAKSKTTEAGVCIPFLASWPAVIPSNQKSQALIDFSDIYPTLLEVSGAAIDTKMDSIDGKSFTAVLKGKVPSVRKWIMSMGGGNHARLTEKGVENQFNYRDRVIRNMGFKLYIDSRGQPEKFIDLQADPYEKINLLDSIKEGNQRDNFEMLFQVVGTFPSKDQDPRYLPNPKQPWDVPVTAKSDVWKQ